MVTCRKVTGLITDGCHWNWNFSCRAQESTQLLKEKYEQYLLRGMGSRCVGLITLPPSCAECLVILGASTSWSPKGLSRSVYVQCGQTDGGTDITKLIVVCCHFTKAPETVPYHCMDLTHLIPPTSIKECENYQQQFNYALT